MTLLLRSRVMPSPGSTVTMQSLDSSVPAAADLRISIMLPPSVFYFFILRQVYYKTEDNANILYFIYFIIFCL